jgi:hypothetical protein
MLFVLSMIAEMIKQEPRLHFPFTRKFIINVFSIDRELLEQSTFKSRIIAILAVIYSNLSKQSRLVKKLDVGKGLKCALLDIFSLIDESFSMKLFNQAILNLQSKGVVTFTTVELAKHKVL